MTRELGFTIACVVTFPEIFLSPCSLGLLSPVLLHHLQGSLEHFWQGRSSDHQAPHLLFLWECLTSLSLWKDGFARYRVLCRQFFPSALESMNTLPSAHIVLYFYWFNVVPLWNAPLFSSNACYLKVYFVLRELYQLSMD